MPARSPAAAPRRDTYRSITRPVSERRHHAASESTVSPILCSHCMIRLYAVARLSTTTAIVVAHMGIEVKGTHHDREDHASDQSPQPGQSSQPALPTRLTPPASPLPISSCLRSTRTAVKPPSRCRGCWRRASAWCCTSIRYAMTPGCTTEACDFRDNIARLTALGFTVLGVSKKPIRQAAAFPRARPLVVPAAVGREYDRASAFYGAYGEKKLYGRTHIGVIRSTFVISVSVTGAAGTIEIARYNVRAKGHVASLMKALQ